MVSHLVRGELAVAPCIEPPPTTNTSASHRMLPHSTHQWCCRKLTGKACTHKVARRWHVERHAQPAPAGHTCAAAAGPAEPNNFTFSHPSNTCFKPDFRCLNRSRLPRRSSRKQTAGIPRSRHCGKYASQWAELGARWQLCYRGAPDHVCHTLVAQQCQSSPFAGVAWGRPFQATSIVAKTARKWIS